MKINSLVQNEVQMEGLLNSINNYSFSCAIIWIE